MRYGCGWRWTVLGLGYAVHEGCMRAAQKYEDSPEAEKSMQRRSVSDHTWIYADDLGLICGVEYINTLSKRSFAKTCSSRPRGAGGCAYTISYSIERIKAVGGSSPIKPLGQSPHSPGPPRLTSVCLCLRIVSIIMISTSLVFALGAALAVSAQESSLAYSNPLQAKVLLFTLTDGYVPFSCFIQV